MQEMEVDSWAGTARSITVHAAQTVTDFADASHSESAKSTTTTVLYGIFSSENSYPCTVIFIPSLDHLEYTMNLIYNQIYNIDIFH